ncbi:thioredoxin family protein [Siansivirga zeaxanthinifaciens]|uniref:Thiol-disulfide isomerase n=1 Tax=Siansivirga zeaxanthinifaciens CC-SAMT-1 TaxID=1454006 RepID=A0A0C5WD27_9FLAO|nr:thioredoxin family protein [Siansivirga zeaxanthinifaciens]AJR04167.1 thiol-disulfide isomerase [Siansivirga zeaxanthinifaciens CC-SAMT-1]
MKIIIFTSVLLLTLGFSLSAQNWITNFEQAKEIASKKNQNIVLVFQGSDWCAPCMKLNKEIWSAKEFQNLADHHFVMLQADFPRKKANKLSDALTAQNAKLAETYNSQGFFPLVVVLNSKGDVLGKTGYEKTSPTNYFKKLNAFEK